jgi:DNA-directed RNA polymerase specialized sigma subunit
LGRTRRVLIKPSELARVLGELRAAANGLSLEPPDAGTEPAHLMEGLASANSRLTAAPSIGASLPADPTLPMLRSRFRKSAKSRSSAKRGKRPAEGRMEKPPLTSEQQKLVTDHYYLVEAEVRSALRAAWWAKKEDLLQEGALGLIEAARARSRDEREPFGPFARVSVQRAMRSSKEFTRGVDRKRYGAIMRAHKLLLTRGVLRPGAAEISEACREAGHDISEKQVEDVLAAVARADAKDIEELERDGVGIPAERPPGDAWHRALSAIAKGCQLTDDEQILLFHGFLEIDAAETGRRLKINAQAVRTRKTRLREKIQARLREELARIGAEAELVILVLDLVKAAREGPGPRRAFDDVEPMLGRIRLVLLARIQKDPSLGWLLDLVKALLDLLNEGGES